MGKTAGEVVAAVGAASTAPAAARLTAECWSNQPACGRADGGVETVMDRCTLTYTSRMRRP
uniref:Predicted protein n=1 Tax=Hordeum vulgare subsp. vulgare TaxID=112509 RepID=F2DYM8_HORVV|nr:predicted protein [Hordeum vulgare subsp. vulgare]